MLFIIVCLQIDRNLKTKSDSLLNQEFDLEKPGFAQNYCLHCAKYFINLRALEDHFKTKVHKRRMKALEAEPFTQEESYLAAGHGSYVKPQIRKMLTQPSKEEYTAGKRVEVVFKTPEELMTKKQKRRSLSKKALNLDDSVEMKE